MSAMTYSLLQDLSVNISVMLLVTVAFVLLKHYGFVTQQLAANAVGAVTVAVGIMTTYDLGRWAHWRWSA